MTRTSGKSQSTAKILKFDPNTPGSRARPKTAHVTHPESPKARDIDHQETVHGDDSAAERRDQSGAQEHSRDIPESPESPAKAAPTLSVDTDTDQKTFVKSMEVPDSPGYGDDFDTSIESPRSPVHVHAARSASKQNKTS